MPKGWENRSDRRTQVRPRRRYLIVCEDSKSSLDYLTAFEIPQDFAEIVTEGGAGNTVSVVEKALELKKKAEYANLPFVHIWCVIDRDEFPVDRYRRAFELVRGLNDVSVVWANECFELWYLLHFCYRDTAIGRADLRKELSKPERLNRKYDKADKQVFELLAAKRADAHRNAERLLKFNPSPHKNPSTNVQRLVDHLVVLQAAARET
jgi:hypothetical protein